MNRAHFIHRTVFDRCTCCGGGFDGNGDCPEYCEGRVIDGKCELHIKPEYLDLWETISIEGFDYMDYRNGEENIIKPRLAEKGFMNATFGMGERDSFGPLTRIVYTTNPEGYLTKFIYG